jgi:beta-glucosidase
VDQLPPFEDYAMAGRTYRYFEGEVLYSFGYGLSYTSFEIQNLWVSHEQMSSHDTLRLSCEVVNTGAVIGDEVVQVYLKDEEASVPVPRHSLVGFKRVRLAPGWTEHVAFEIQPKQFALVNDDGKWMLEPGMFTVFVGGGQPGTVDGVSRRVELLGPGMVIE